MITSAEIMIAAEMSATASNDIQRLEAHARLIVLSARVKRMEMALDEIFQDNRKRMALDEAAGEAIVETENRARRAKSHRSEFRCVS